MKGAIFVTVLVACGPSNDSPDDGGYVPACEEYGDDDNDGLSNALEGCQTNPPRDTDHDGQPDYLDTDSDADGARDGDEDRNGDGMLGTCAVTCDVVADCPPDHACTTPIGADSGICVSWFCADGETLPNANDTDGDGVADGMEGTFICNQPGEDDPTGLKPFKTADYPAPNWKIALEVDAVEATVDVPSSLVLESAYQFDLPDAEVAGFLASRAITAGEEDAVLASQSAINRIQTIAGVSQVIIRASGTRNVSLDGEDTVLSTILVVNTGGVTDATALRRKVIAALLGYPETNITFHDVAWTSAPSGSFAVMLQTLHRTEVGQVLYMGGVTTQALFDDPSKPSGYNLDDLSNGSGLTVSGNGDTVECDPFLITTVPKADIIWVIDESGSMSDDRSRLAENATVFFNKAVSAGLDFRMGVTDMDDGNDGRFARRTATTSDDDRWLLASELAMFQQDIEDPSGPGYGDGGSEHGLTQGRAAINRHVPRSDSDPQKARTDASLVVIYVTDEHPDEIEDAAILAEGNPTPDPATVTEIVTFMNPYVLDFTGNDAVAHAIAVPTTQPTCSSGGEAGWGYNELVTTLGGQFGSICQPMLDATVDAIIGDIIGNASPITLQWVPISLTISVSKNGVAVPRSRTGGFDFRASSNSIVFSNMPFDPLMPTEVVVSYRRWSSQVPVE
jgi:hypothetical protein